MTSMLTSEVLAKQAEREELDALVKDFLAKNRPPVTEPVQPQRPVINTWRSRNRASADEAQAAKLKNIADKHCAKPKPDNKAKVASLHEVRSAKARERRKELAKQIAPMREKQCTTLQISKSLGVSYAMIVRAAKENGIELNHSPAARAVKE
ncbi:hypothetical protein SAMN05216421_1074 [Halopseudomonas xinjiangensis]|uniref:Uncharacterized protein n=1 Tax=Halopseudomonas xinjiangensis TaxID=487184 RepID=A0A1H1Q7F5_9GAMM|nr:hypothetical protein [Halopseudomonas xinjiangensis]SDS19330.1 hypothetical protein SAMN05216421_1074 [Halopseudomonas xinjiangensis]